MLNLHPHSYPECCVRARDILVFARTDPRPILQNFFAEFHAKLPSVCGRKLCFVTKTKYHIPGLLSVYEVSVFLDLQFLSEQVKEKEVRIKGVDIFTFDLFEKNKHIFNVASKSIIATQSIYFQHTHIFCYQ